MLIGFEGYLRVCLWCMCGCNGLFGNRCSNLIVWVWGQFSDAQQVILCPPVTTTWNFNLDKDEIGPSNGLWKTRPTAQGSSSGTKELPTTIVQYRWVPLCPNMLKSKLTFVQYFQHYISIPAVLFCPKYTELEGFLLGFVFRQSRTQVTTWVLLSEHLWPDSRSADIVHFGRGNADQSFKFSAEKASFEKSSSVVFASDNNSQRIWIG